MVLPPYRKHQVLQSSDELASLEARLKEMEARLKKSQQAHNRMSMSHISTGAAGGSAGYARPGPPQHDAPPPPPPKDDDAASAKARSRPGTARATQQAPSSGNMPPTPGASEGEYYLVTKADLDDAPR